jgi:1-deoxy-D-xylulose-5-phosphate synthase
MKHSYPLLTSIDSPLDLRKLPESMLLQLAYELRQFLLDSVSQTGGHLASNLGVVELSIALHYVFDTPNDRLVWDVGHQCYAHKILTGRAMAMSTLRQYNGISGFPKRSESVFDSFGVGHSSTSISAALGMAIAAKHLGIKRSHIAVIGDGAMTAGMAFEALNHAGSIHDIDILVILNDNEMSISPNVGSLSNYLAKILTSKLYKSVRDGGKSVLSHVPPPVRELAKRTEEQFKTMVAPGLLFEELGFNYIGPIDGHDLTTLIATLGNLRDLSGPQLLHIVTKKGKGFSVAEQNPCFYHGVGQFDKITGHITNTAKTAKQAKTYTQIFGQWLCDMAAIDQRLIAITPAMREGSGLVHFSELFPERYIDVGIAEQHAVTLAAALACEGLKPVVAIYSTFLQRAYDQLIHDVALQNLSVMFAIDRAGIVGADGPTHIGAFDIAYLRCIPNIIIMTPSDENECRQMLTTGFMYEKGASAIRYPRGCGVGVMVTEILAPLLIGKAEIRRQGKKIAFLAFGSLLFEALEAALSLDATVVNMRFVKPLDHVCISKLAVEHELLVTIEEGVIAGGAGTAVGEYLHSIASNVNLLQLGLPDEFIEHGDNNLLLSKYGLDSVGIIAAVNKFLAQT